MRARPTAPRIEPLEPPPAVRDHGVLGGIIRPVNLFGTLRHNPSVGRPLVALTQALLDPALIDPRLRELVILRMAWRTQSEYEYGQHVVAGRHAGLSDTEILLTSEPLDRAPWTALEAAALQMADDIAADDCVSDDTWAILRPLVDDRDALSLVALACCYRMVAGVLNSLGVQPEDDLPRWPTG